MLQWNILWGRTELISYDAISGLVCRACKLHHLCAILYCIVVCALSGPTIFLYVTSFNGTVFGGKKKISDRKCVFIFYTACLNYFSFWEEFNEISSQMCVRFHVKYPLFLSDFNESWNFLKRVSKNTQILSFTKILLMGSELFHVDRQTDITKVTVAFRNFASCI